jgi:DNA-binding transcriptional LysR family regulator
MDLRRLRYFAAVAEHLNFRKAAEVLNTSQPSLSQQMRGLERDIGVQLFERNKRSVRLTNAGVEFLAGIRTVIAEFEASGQRARAAKEGLRGRLRLGAAGMILVEDLPPIVQAYRRAFPDVDVSLVVMRSPDLEDALRLEKIDIAFGNSIARSDDLHTLDLWSFPSRAVVPVHHPVAARPAVHLRELNGETLIVHPRRGGAGGANSVVMRLVYEQGFIPGNVREVSEIADLETLIGLVACGLGITILPSPFERLNWPLVVFVPIMGTQYASRISACWRIGDTSPLIEKFLRIARDRQHAPAIA